MKNRLLVTHILLFAIVSVSFAQLSNDNKFKTEGTNFEHRPNTVIRTEFDSLVVKVLGEGTQPVIMIPGHMQDENIYQNFIDRNVSAAKFYIAIPPGMGGTPAYKWPEESEEFITRPWTSKFEKELAKYIENNISSKPYMIVNWYTGLGIALHLANRYPNMLSGIIFIGPTGRFPYNRWYRINPLKAGGEFDVVKQRSEVINFLDFWRNVDELTWHNNMFGPSFYSKNELLATQVIYNEAKHPMPISLRYFTEYLVDDLSDEIKNLKIPVHIVSVIPSVVQYNKRLKETPSEGKADIILTALRKSTKMDWQDEKKNITLTFFEGSGLFAWEDDPKEFDQIFTRFISSN